MKKYFFLLIIFGFFRGFSVKAQTWNSGTNPDLSSGKSAAVIWNTKDIELGLLKQGKPAKAVFKMKNNGGQPIFISKAEGSCGCTQIEYPKRPIKPGETVNITAIYDAEDVGVFAKTVTLTMNIEESTQILHITGEVK
jgi:hypothetical protein